MKDETEGHATDVTTRSTPSRRLWYRSLARKMFGGLGLFRHPWLESIRAGYEKAGLTVFGEPIPWNAEAVQVETVVWGGGPEENRKEAFSLRTPHSVFVPVAAVHTGEEGITRITFRLPPPRQGAWAEFYWRSRALGRVLLPFLSAQDFLAGLQMLSPTLLARFSDHHIACRTVAASGCDGLLTSGLLTSPTSLLPVLDLNPHVEVTDTVTGAVRSLPLEPAGSQLLARQALLSREVSGWGSTHPVGVRWLVADRVLGKAEMSVVTPAALEESLCLVDAGYLYQRTDRRVALSRYLPNADPAALIGGCYYIASRERGFAGYCPLEVRCRPFGSVHSTTLLRQDVLVMDRPSPLLIPPTTVIDLEQSVLELFIRGRKLGTLPVFRWPEATFSNEGGISRAPDFPWTEETADWEFADRLDELLAGSGDGDGAGAT